MAEIEEKCYILFEEKNGEIFTVFQEVVSDMEFIRGYFLEQGEIGVVRKIDELDLKSKM